MKFQVPHPPANVAFGKFSIWNGAKSHTLEASGLVCQFDSTKTKDINRVLNEYVSLRDVIFQVWDVPSADYSRTQMWTHRSKSIEPKPFWLIAGRPGGYCNPMRRRTTRRYRRDENNVLALFLKTDCAVHYSDFGTCLCFHILWYPIIYSREKNWSQMRTKNTNTSLHLRAKILGCRLICEKQTRIYFCKVTFLKVQTISEV